MDGAGYKTTPPILAKTKPPILMEWFNRSPIVARASQNESFTRFSRRGTGLATLGVPHRDPKRGRPFLVLHSGCAPVGLQDFRIRRGRPKSPDIDHPGPTP